MNSLNFSRISTPENLERFNEEIGAGECVHTEIKRHYDSHLRDKKRVKCLRPKTKSNPSYQRTVVTVWRPMGLQNAEIPVPYGDKILHGESMVNRSILTRKQHLGLLANPKLLTYDPHTVMPLLKLSTECTPRIAKLSAPKTCRVYETMCDFGHALSIAHKEKMCAMLSAQNNILNWRDAHLYLQNLKKVACHKDSRGKKNSKCLSPQMQQEIAVLKKCALMYAIALSNILCTNCQINISQTQKKFADKILETIYNNNLIDCCLPKRKSKNFMHMQLVNAADNCAMFVTNVVCAMDLATRLQEGLDYEGSGFGSDISSEEDEEWSIEEESESEKSLTSSQAALFDLNRLVRILKANYKEKGEDESMQVFEDGKIDILYAEMIDYVQDLVETEESFYAKKQNAYYKIISNMVVEMDPEAWDDEMAKLVCAISAALTMEDEFGDELSARFGQYGTFDRYGRSTEGEDWASYRDSQMSEAERLRQQALLDEQARRQALLDEQARQQALLDEEARQRALAMSMAGEEVDGFDKESLRTAGTDLASLMESGQLGEEGSGDLSAICAAYEDALKTSRKIMPHVPDMVCCSSLKAWAEFISEVAQNSMIWVCWIRRTVQMLKQIFNVARGELVDCDGCPLRIDRFKMIQYANRTRCEIIKWKRYNMYVECVTERVIKCFKNKRVECCELCLLEKVDYRNLSVEHVCSQLIDALNATEYWRNWINEMMRECRTLSDFLTDTESVASDSTSLSISVISEISLPNRRGLGPPQ